MNSFVTFTYLAVDFYHALSIISVMYALVDAYMYSCVSVCLNVHVFLNTAGWKEEMRVKCLSQGQNKLAGGRG